MAQLDSVYTPLVSLNVTSKTVFEGKIVSLLNTTTLLDTVKLTTQGC